MKEKNCEKDCTKRYACEKIEPVWDHFYIFFIILFIISVLSSFVISKILHTFNDVSIHNSYSVTEYEYLDEITNKIIDDGVSINFRNIPKDIGYYTDSNENITFSFYVIKDKSHFVPVETITITLSKDGKIISKEPNFTSEDEYIEYANKLILRDSVTLGPVTGCVLAIILLLILLLIYGISYLHKKYDSWKSKKE